MREELKNFDWHVYGLSEGDFDYTLRMVRAIVEDRMNYLSARVKGAVAHDENGNEIKGFEDDIMDDLAYYTYIDHLFICQYGLWRLQGIFEGILKQEFFPSKKLIGLKSKLDEIRKLSFLIEDDEYEAILSWGQLRNALSHFPPEKYRPSCLDEDDLKEYSNLALKIITDLKGQKRIKGIT